MKNKIVRLVVFGLLAAAIAAAPTQVLAQESKDKPAAKKKDTPKKDAPRVIPFHGKVGAIDTKEKKLWVGKRVFVITSDTRIFKANKPAGLEDGVVGENVSGSYKMAAGGKMEAVKLYFALPNSAAAKVEAKVEKKEK
jgi:hypothetical protein